MIRHEQLLERPQPAHGSLAPKRPNGLSESCSPHSRSICRRRNDDGCGRRRRDPTTLVLHTAPRTDPPHLLAVSGSCLQPSLCRCS